MEDATPNVLFFPFNRNPQNVCDQFAVNRQASRLRFPYVLLLVFLIPLLARTARGQDLTGDGNTGDGGCHDHAGECGSSGGFLYVANFGPGNILSGLQVNRFTGALRPVPGSPFANGVAPISVAVDATGRFVYAPAGDNIVGYRVNEKNGDLTPIAGSPFADSTTPYGVAEDSVYGIAGDPTGRFLYSANYNDGQVGGFRIDPFTGALTRVPGSPFPAGSGPYTVAVDPKGRFVYVSNLGGNISAYRIHEFSGELTPVPGSPFASPPSGFSLTVEPAGRFLYETNQNGTVLGFQIDRATGALSAIAGSPFPAGAGPFSVAADPTGKFLYVVNAAYGPPALCNVSAYRIDHDSGALEQIPGSPFTAGVESDYIAVDPRGRFAYVANYGDDSIGTYAIDAGTGALTPVPDSPFAAGPGPNWIAVDPNFAGPKF
jgi:6-phosphogluconolactonase